MAALSRIDDFHGGGAMRRREFEENSPLKSRLCVAEEFGCSRFTRWRPVFSGVRANSIRLGGPFMHRKEWEYIAICEALRRGGMLDAGRRGLGFAVGNELLPELFSSFGCRILATDLEMRRSKKPLPPDLFNELGFLRDREEHSGQQGEPVEFRPVDMRRPDPDLKDFDFTWSSCALEHLGSIDAGIKFVLDQLKCLRPGGMAVNTLEFNLSSDQTTVTSGPTVVFRRQDVERLLALVEEAGHQPAPLDLYRGEAPENDFVAIPPYHCRMRNSSHLRLQIEGFVATSMILVIWK
jgi:hypothetical protein